jgi:S-adenosylmethionine/arginine decarboxylase-like enzyme
MPAMERGCHLLFEGLSLHLLSNLEAHTFLVECPRLLRLTIFSGPSVYPTEYGLAGIVLVAESHVSLHTVGLEVYGDVFSCRPFATEPVMELAHELLFLDRKPKPRQQVLRRGWGQKD